MSDNIIREKKIISMNSSSATRYLNGSFLSNVVFDFANVLAPDDSIVYVECGVGNAEIPASFYNVDITNNIFNYVVNATNFSITIPPGNFNFTSLVTQMTTLFAVNAHTFSMTLNRNSNILTMALTSGGTWNTLSSSSIYSVLGFAANTSYTITANTITFPFLFDLLGIKKLKIFSTNISVDSVDSVGNATSNLLCTISVNQPGFNMIIYSNIDGLYSHIRNKYISTIDITIKDENGNFVNFNNVGWTLTLNLIIYRKIDVLINQLKINKDTTIDEPPPNA
jgi:hypothetical protein